MYVGMEHVLVYLYVFSLWTYFFMFRLNCVNFWLGYENLFQIFLVLFYPHILSFIYDNWYFKKSTFQSVWVLGLDTSYKVHHVSLKLFNLFFTFVWSNLPCFEPYVMALEVFLTKTLGWLQAMVAHFCDKNNVFSLGTLYSNAYGD